jgi:hypothetical protein
MIILEKFSRSSSYCYLSCFFRTSANDRPPPQDLTATGATTGDEDSVSDLEVCDLSSALDPSVLTVPELFTSSTFCCIQRKKYG